MIATIKFHQWMLKLVGKILSTDNIFGHSQSISPDTYKLQNKKY